MQYFDEDGNEVDESQLLKDLRKQIKDLSQERDTFKTEAQKFKGAVRERTLAEVLEAKGVSPKVAKFIPADVEGDEAVSTWLAENGDVFGFSKPAEDSTPAGATADDLKAIAQVQSASQGGLTPEKAQEQITALRNATTPEQLAAVMAQYGATPTY